MSREVVESSRESGSRRVNPSSTHARHVNARNLIIHRGQQRHSSRASETPESTPPAPSTGLYDKGATQSIIRELPPSGTFSPRSIPGHDSGPSVDRNSSPPEPGSASAVFPTGSHPPSVSPTTPRHLQPALYSDLEPKDRFLKLVNVSAEQLDVTAACAVHNAVGDLVSIPLRDVLQFVQKALGQLEAGYETADLDDWHRSAFRLRGVLKAHESRISFQTPFDLWQRCLLSRVLAFQGNLSDAVTNLHAANTLNFTEFERAGVIRAYTTIIKSTFRHFNALRVLDLLLADWRMISDSLIKGADEDQEMVDLKFRGEGYRFRYAAYSIISRMRDPIKLLKERVAWHRDTRSRLAQILIYALLKFDFPFEALDVYRELKAQALELPVRAHLKLIRALVREDSIGQAKAAFISCQVPREGDNRRAWFSTALFLAGHSGDTDNAERLFRTIEEHGWAVETDQSMLMHAYATKGDPKTTVDRFNEFFPLDEKGRRRNSPTLVHYSIVLHAHARQGNMESINDWLGAISDAGLTPDAHVFTMIIQAFAIRGEVDAIAAVLKQMTTLGITPNVVTYTVIVSFFAKRKDPVSAEAMYKRAISEGIIPSRRLVTSVLNAHVEAGNWLGVVHAFDYIRTSPVRHIRFTLEVYNTVLKAYVNSGAPFRLIHALIKKMEAGNLTPDAYTYALLIQSACDHRNVSLAYSLYQEFVQSSPEWSRDDIQNVYVMTIMIGGFLRCGQKGRALRLYHSMPRLGITPDATTFRTLINDFAHRGGEANLRVAEEFLEAVTKNKEHRQQWERPDYGRGSGLASIYVPLLRTYAEMRRPEDVERAYQDMLDKGGEPTLGVLTTLLDAYRRTFNIEAVVQLWPQIFELGLKHARDRPLFEEDEVDPNYQRLQGNILCVPLSIYIDALSAAGLHSEIADVWRKFQLHHLTFDSHNWNHLCIALVRAGEVERAFQVVENVIIPYEEQSRLLQHIRVTDTSSLLVYNDDALQSIPDARAHNIVTDETRRFLDAQLDRRLSESPPPEDVEDIAHELFALHTISPAWNTWQPHPRVLLIMGQVLRALRNGHFVEPVRRFDDVQERPPELPEVSLQKRALAHDAAGRILQTCPQASLQAYQAFTNLIDEMSERKRRQRVRRYG